MSTAATKRSRALAGAIAFALGCGIASGAGAAVVTFPLDLGGFNTAAGDPAVAVNFDSIVAGTDIGGQSFAGATLSATGSALQVVVGADTQTDAATYTSGIIDAATNKLLPTSGANVLSPGGGTFVAGPDPATESDGVNIVFDTPVSAFGFDHISQSADGFSFTTISVFDASDVTLFSGTVAISNLGGGGAPGGADFWGIVSDAADIKRVTITEGDADGSFPDNNIGFDTFRFAGDIEPPPPPPTGVPIPAAVLTTPLLLGVAEFTRRRMNRCRA